MKKILLFGFMLVFGVSSFSQVIYKEVASPRLDAKRKIKIQLPRNYNSNKNKSYPVIIALDGDYLFEPVAGNVDYYSYWNEMPESIVVGVMQGEDRFTDCSYDSVNHLPDEDGSKFFEFIGMELMPYLDKNYRTAKFTIAVGHDYTANFINYYLFKDPPLFHAYINLSPDFAPLMENNLAERIPNIQQKIFYYLATGTDDVQNLKESAERTNRLLQPLNSNLFHFYFDNFDGANHYTLVGKAIPGALNKIFTMYRPITSKEYDDMLTSDRPVYDFFIEKYNDINELFGLSIDYRTGDLLAAAQASEKKRDWDSLEKIAKLAQRYHPNSALGGYYLARYYEETGNPRKAMKTYRSGFDKEDADFITAEMMLDKAAQIQKDFGY